jgi:hypothetical protein
MEDGISHLILVPLRCSRAECIITFSGNSPSKESFNPFLWPERGFNSTVVVATALDQAHLMQSASSLHDVCIVTKHRSSA